MSVSAAALVLVSVTVLVATGESETVGDSTTAMEDADPAVNAAVTATASVDAGRPFCQISKVF